MTSNGKHGYQNKVSKNSKFEEDLIVYLCLIKIIFNMERFVISYQIKNKRFTVKNTHKQTDRQTKSN
jgi:hypothetical protein